MICPECRSEYEPTAEELAEVGLERSDLKDGLVYLGMGCERCIETGYIGRSAIYEMLTVNEAIREKVIARAGAPILSPRELYERVGLTANVVFTSGAVLEDDGEVKIYYGGADTVQCVATARLDDLIEACYKR